jgi:hypothetical protein
MSTNIWIEKVQGNQVSIKYYKETKMKNVWKATYRKKENYDIGRRALSNSIQKWNMQEDCKDQKHDPVQEKVTINKLWKLGR